MVELQESQKVPETAEQNLEERSRHAVWYAMICYNAKLQTEINKRLWEKNLQTFIFYLEGFIKSIQK